MQYATNSIAWSETNKRKNKCNKSTTVPVLGTLSTYFDLLYKHGSGDAGRVNFQSAYLQSLLRCIGDQQKHLHGILEFSEAVWFATAKSW